MKKFGIIALILAIMAPGASLAAVEAGAGDITLFSHIDFVYRSSAEDDDEGWPGYDSYNLEFAVLGIGGRLGDNVDWVITNAFAFQGPMAAVNTALVHYSL